MVPNGLSAVDYNYNGLGDEVINCQELYCQVDRAQQQGQIQYFAELQKTLRRNGLDPLIIANECNTLYYKDEEGEYVLDGKYCENVTNVVGTIPLFQTCLNESRRGLCTWNTFMSGQEDMQDVQKARVGLGVATVLGGYH